MAKFDMELRQKNYSLDSRIVEQWLNDTLSISVKFIGLDGAED